jgi:predicted short-subunit dehydrogenase-like oxidoreductase (DUF2520 family)
MAFQRIVVIGSGRVASALATALANAGVNIIQVYSRNQAHAKTLAYKVGALACADSGQIDSTADLYIISVSDASINQIVEIPALHGKTIVHTAGSVPIDVLQSATEQFGVFYPLQTFSYGRTPDIKKVPFCLEASNNELLQNLKDLATRLSDSIYFINSQQRLYLHIAAVFANNFSNHMFVLAEKLLQHYQMPFEMLRPLLEETVAKLADISPSDAQTGPAIRRDQPVMDSHRQLLADMPELQNFYTFVSESIEKSHQSK